MSTSPLVRAGIIRSEAARLRGLEDARERDRTRFNIELQAFENLQERARKRAEELTTAGLPERDRLNSLLNTQEEDRARQQQAQQQERRQAQQQAFDSPSRDATAQQRRLAEAQRVRQAQAEIQQVQQAQQRQMQRQLQDQAFDARTAPQQQMQSDAYRERLGQLAKMQQASGRSGSLITGDLYDAPKLTPEEFNRRLKLIEGTGDLTPEQLEIRSALATAEPGQSVSFFYNGKFITRADLPNNGRGIVPDGVELVLPPSETGARAGLPTPTETVTARPRDEEAVRFGYDPELNLGGGAALVADPDEQERLANLARLEAMKGKGYFGKSSPADPSPFKKDVGSLVAATIEGGSEAAKTIGESQRQAASLDAAGGAAILAGVKYIAGRMGQYLFGSAAGSEKEKQQLANTLEKDLTEASNQIVNATVREVAEQYVSDDDMFETPLGATERATSEDKPATAKNVNSATPRQIAQTEPGDMLKALRAMNVKEPAAVRNAREAHRLLGEVAADQIQFFASIATLGNMSQVGAAISKVYENVATRRIELSQGLLGAYSEAAITAGDPTRAARFISDALGYEVRVAPSGDDFQILVGGQVEGVYTSKDKLMQRLKAMADPAFAAQLSATQAKLRADMAEFTRKLRLEQFKLQGQLDLEVAKNKYKDFKYQATTSDTGITIHKAFDPRTGEAKPIGFTLPNGLFLKPGDFKVYATDPDGYLEALGIKI